MSGARTVCPSRRGVVTAKQRNRTWRKKYGLKVDLVAMWRFPDLQLALTTHQVDAAVCPEFDAMHERYCGDLLNGVCAPRRGRMLAFQVRRSVTWATRPWHSGAALFHAHVVARHYRMACCEKNEPNVWPHHSARHIRATSQVHKCALPR